MILFKGKKYLNYIDLLYSQIRNSETIDTHNYLYSKVFYCKAALENKFKKEFQLKEVKEILADKSWQKPSTP